MHTDKPEKVGDAYGLGESRRAILDLLKRRGAVTTSRLAVELGLNAETVRDHLQTLLVKGLVRRAGTVRGRRGRPGSSYELTPAAEMLFPRREGEILRGLAAYLRDTGNEQLLEQFVVRLVSEHREEALARVECLEGRERLVEVARILTELGFMAEVEGHADALRLRLCHCPMRELVAESPIPCRVEIGLVAELCGETLARVSHIPSGDASCSYQAAVA